MAIDNQAQILKYKLAVSQLRKDDDPLKYAHTIRHLGDAYRRAAQAELAEPCYIEALAIYRNREDAPRLDLANAIRGFAVLKSDLGALVEAESLWREAHELYASVNVLAGVAGSAARLALIAQKQGQLEQSQQWLDQAIAVAGDAGDPEILFYVSQVEAQLKS